ncbi:hypothetical protein B0J18DRAFT_493411 [Chaetomium sp. MPI-SDFR-AT-0129]|nr:hypothetical protein B0J18DRAFT_493411 [Chaetomium sp. MPI-SDFR-AT-0129]
MAKNKSTTPAEGHYTHVADDQPPSPLHPGTCPNWPTTTTPAAATTTATMEGMPLPLALQRAGLTCTLNYPPTPRLRILLLRAAEQLDLALHVRGAFVLPLQDPLPDDDNNDENENEEGNDDNGVPKIRNLPPPGTTFADLMMAGIPHRLDYCAERKELVRVWQEEARRHIERVCVGMWRMGKKVRQELGGMMVMMRESGEGEGGKVDVASAADAARLELYLRCFPGTTAGTTGTATAAGTATAPAAGDPPAAGKEVLLPRLVTFVLRDVNPREGASEGGKPDATGQGHNPVNPLRPGRAVIRYLEPGQRDRQGQVSLTNALTEAFVCVKGMAPAVEDRYDPGQSHQRRRFVGRFTDEGDQNEDDQEDDGGKEKGWACTMLVFAAGVCVGEGKSARGGVAVVTKDTVHFHEERVLKSLLEIDKRVEAMGFERASMADLKKLKLCINALEKPNRGHNRNLYRGVQGDETPDEAVGACPLLGGVHGFELERRGVAVDAEQFGLVKSRHRTWWIGRTDEARNQRLREVREQAMWAIQVAEEMERLAAEAQDAADASHDPDENDHQDETNTNLADTMKNVSLDDGPDNNNSNTPPPNPLLPMPIETARQTIKLFQDAETNISHLGVPERPQAAATTETNNQDANNKKKPSKPRLPPRYPATPNRAAARALLAAVQIHPFDLGHCTRLVIATDSEHAVEMATSRLANMLLDPSAPPLRTARTKQPVEDGDLWWAFAGAVKDLAYQGVEVAILKCAAGGGVVIPCEMPFGGKKEGVAAAGEDGGKDGSGKDASGGHGNLIFGMPQAIDAAKTAALNAVKLDMQALMLGKKRPEGAVDRVIAMHV